MSARTYRTFTHKEAVFRICCSAYDAVIEEIVRQRRILEDYITVHPEFKVAFQPIDLREGAPESARRMDRAARLTGVGPMAAVAGTMAQLAAEAGIRAGAQEAIIENGGDIYIHSGRPVIIGLLSGTRRLDGQLAFSLRPGELPLSICASSGKMGHSASLGKCDLAVAVSIDAALADAAATMTANCVLSAEDISPAVEAGAAVEGIRGVLVIQEGRIGMAGHLPELVRMPASEVSEAD